MTEALRNQIQAVIQARKKHADLASQRLAAQEMWELAHTELLDAFRESLDQKLEAEQALKDMALTTFRLTGEKKPAPGVEVKMFKVLDYIPWDAFNWAVKHSLALQLNIAEFEKIAKVNTPDFVTITEKPKATIAQDLEKTVNEA